MISIDYRGFTVAIAPSRKDVVITLEGRLIASIPIPAEVSVAEALRIAQHHLDAKILKVA